VDDLETRLASDGLLAERQAVAVLGLRADAKEGDRLAGAEDGENRLDPGDVGDLDRATLVPQVAEALLVDVPQAGGLDGGASVGRERPVTAPRA
jgi:hypothetical protein